MNTFYFLLGGLFLVYILISASQKKRSKQRKNRNFMEGQRLKDRNAKKSDM